MVGARDLPRTGKRRAKDNPKNRGELKFDDQFNNDRDEDYEYEPNRRESPLRVIPPVPLEKAKEEEEAPKKFRRNPATEPNRTQLPDFEFQNPNTEEWFSMDMMDLFQSMQEMNNIELDPIVELIDLYNSENQVYFPYRSMDEKYPMPRELLKMYISRWLTYELETFQIAFHRLQKKLEISEYYDLTPEQYFIVINDYSQYLNNIPELVRIGKKWLKYQNIRNEQGF